MKKATSKTATSKKATSKKGNAAKKREKSTLSQLNQEWKQETKSLSAICRYIQKADENSLIQKRINEINEVNGTKLTTAYCTPRNLIKFATDKERFTNIAKDKKVNFVKGEPKQFFSIYVVIGRFLNRAAKSKSKNTKK